MIVHRFSLTENLFLMQFDEHIQKKEQENADSRLQVCVSRSDFSFLIFFSNHSSVFQSHRIFQPIAYYILSPQTFFVPIARELCFHYPQTCLILKNHLFHQVLSNHQHEQHEEAPIDAILLDISSNEQVAQGSCSFSTIFTSHRPAYITQTENNRNNLG